MHTQRNNALPHTKLDPTSASYGNTFAAYDGNTFAGMRTHQCMHLLMENSASKSKQRAKPCSKPLAGLQEYNLTAAIVCS
jgi:hypothetical protein